MRRNPLIAVVVLAALAPSARAAERITFSNGFDYLCDHHAEIEGRVRLYLSPGEDSYIERLPEDIVSVERVPDPPLQPRSAETAPRTPPVAGSKVNSNSTQEPKLSEADLHEMLIKAGKEHNLDVDLLASLIKAESAGNAHAVSRAGAQGLMQLMPATAKNLGVNDSFKPDENVRGGTTYLDALLIRYNDNLSLALAAYNAGPEAVAKYNGIPPYRETRAYVARVIHEFNRRVQAREAEAKRLAAQGNATR
ncbi:MAG: lytic transglycosylase domain-containing protein [Terracidiphilus sp.]|jgi:hypothetical protein